jgi:hypothetical protein
MLNSAHTRKYNITELNINLIISTNTKVEKAILYKLCGIDPIWIS